MADFASSSSASVLAPEASMAAIAIPHDDINADCCSICLELFDFDDPASITSCKHEYHLHCILEWSQRSKECPICWQSLSMKDSDSQELLAVVGKERHARSRNPAPLSPIVHYIEDDEDEDHDSADDYVFDERIMQHLAAASRARSRGRDRQRFSGVLSPEVLYYAAHHHTHEEEHESSSDECNYLSPRPAINNSPASVTPVALSAESSPPPVVFRNAVDGSIAFKPRVLYSQSPSIRPHTPSPSENPTFSDSIKSKWSAASARYKESFSKGTRGLKEKLLARNNSVKELSKGVHREMSAGFAGVVRMMERLDLTSKKSGVSLDSSASNISTKGKGVLEGILVQSITKNSVRVSHEISSSDGSSLPAVVIPSRVEVLSAKDKK